MHGSSLIYPARSLLAQGFQVLVFQPLTVGGSIITTVAQAGIPG
jgi:hypothetical protein